MVLANFRIYRVPVYIGLLSDSVIAKFMLNKMFLIYQDDDKLGFKPFIDLRVLGALDLRRFGYVTPFENDHHVFQLLIVVVSI